MFAQLLLLIHKRQVTYITNLHTPPGSASFVHPDCNVHHRSAPHRCLILLPRGSPSCCQPAFEWLVRLPPPWERRPSYAIALQAVRITLSSAATPPSAASIMATYVNCR
jgi:hypothetical protein